MRVSCPIHPSHSSFHYVTDPSLQRIGQTLHKCKRLSILAADFPETLCFAHDLHRTWPSQSVLNGFMTRKRNQLGHDEFRSLSWYFYESGQRVHAMRFSLNSRGVSKPAVEQRGLSQLSLHVIPKTFKLERHRWGP